MEQDPMIIGLCQQGHPAGFSRLVAAYQKRISRTAYSFVQNREDALDLTQEVLLRTVRAIDSIDGSRPLWPWLRQVTTNLAMTLLKRRTGHLSLHDLPEGAVPADPAAEPAWTLIDLRKALAADFARPARVVSEAGQAGVEGLLRAGRRALVRLLRRKGGGRR